MTVEFVHRISGRSLVLVSGRLEGAALRIGDEIAVRTGDGPEIRTVVRTVEMHGPPGVATIGVDGSLSDRIEVGSSITAHPS
ncbi:hypothetical protein AB0J86_23240 [Micromonospora sp. NPDC049559]|uniref:hypothetical protein n=1 Tax=Micromonospora sp. NPDC049559 TaxID=3155923 RepID=UPI003430ACED